MTESCTPELAQQANCWFNRPRLHSQSILKLHISTQWSHQEGDGEEEEVGWSGLQDTSCITRDGSYWPLRLQAEMSRKKLSIVAAETRQPLLWQIDRTTSLSVMSKQGCESWPFGGFGAISWTCKTIFTLVMSSWVVAYIKHEMMFRVATINLH